MNLEEIKLILENDDIEKFKNLKLNYGEKIGKNGRNILMEAIFTGSENIVKYVLQKNKELINSVDDFGNPPIYFSVLKDKRNIFDYMLNNFKIDFNKKAVNGKSVIDLIAVLRKDYFIKRIAITNGEKSISVDKDVAELMRSNDLLEKQEKVEVNIEKIRGSMTNNNKSNNGNNEEDESYDLNNMSQDDIRDELTKMGFECISYSTRDIKGREDEVDSLKEMIDKNQNVVIVAPEGYGKSTIVEQVAQKTTKQIFKIPSELLRGDKYRGGTNEKIKKWLPLFLKLENAVLFVDDMDVLSPSTKSDDGGVDTPTNILKEYLHKKENGLQIIGTTSPKKFISLKEVDNGFLSKFVNGLNEGFKLKELKMEEMMEIILSEVTVKQFHDVGFDVKNDENFKRIVGESLKLLNDFIFNQKFPYKAMDFLNYLLSKNKVESLTKEQIQEEFSKKYDVPLEYVHGYLDENSKYLQIEDKLKENICGQNVIVEEVAENLASFVTRSSTKDRTPLNFFFMGPSGVGKTEVARVMSEHFKYPTLSINCSEFNGIEGLQNFIEKIKEHVSKNYNGIIVLDEIEKGDKKLGDVFLSLGEGRIGSGDDMVFCGNQIIIATSNTGSPEILELKKMAKENQIEDFNFPKEVLRNILLNSGDFKRPEVLGRFKSFFAFSPIDKDIAKEIIRKIIVKQDDIFLKDRNIHLDVDDKVIDYLLDKRWSMSNAGARDLETLVKRDLLGFSSEASKYKRDGTVINIFINAQNKVEADFIQKNGDKKSFIIMDERLSPEEKFKRLRALMLSESMKTDNPVLVKPK